MCFEEIGYVVIVICYISPGTIYESDDSKTDPNLNSNPNRIPKP